MQSAMALLLGVPLVEAFSTMQGGILTSRSGGKDDCPTCTMSEAAGYACGDVFEGGFCYSKGYRSYCEYVAASCATSSASAHCRTYGRLVGEGQCPPLTETATDSIFCLERLTLETDLRGLETPLWCGAIEDEDECESSYLSFAYYSAGQTMFQECVWSSDKNKCVKNAKFSEGSKYDVINICSDVCLVNVAKRTDLGSDACNKGDFFAVQERLSSKDACESTFYSVTAQEETVYPCKFHGVTFDEGNAIVDPVCDPSFYCPDIDVNDPDSICVTGCNCLPDLPGCSNVNEQCCRNVCWSPGLGPENSVCNYECSLCGMLVLP
jgi:hypothetical protein